MGSVHSQAYANMPDIQLAGIIDLRTAVAEPLATQLGVPFFANYDEFWRNCDADVVDICIPTCFHRQYIERAASAGKHVICEKPLALTAQDAQAAIDVCRDNHVRLFVGQVVRFFPEYQRMHAVVTENQLGQVGTVRTFRGGVFPTAWNDWYANAKMSGTLLVDLLVHDFDFLRWCFGDVKRVFARSLLPYEANRVDHAFVSLRFNSGVIAHVEGSWALPSGFFTEVEIAGATGTLQHKSADSAPVHFSRRHTVDGKPVVEVPSSPLAHSPYYLELAHFMECLRTGGDSLVEPEDALEALKISLAALESATSGQVVSLGSEEKGCVGK